MVKIILRDATVTGDFPFQSGPIDITFEAFSAMHLFLTLGKEAHKSVIDYRQLSLLIQAKRYLRRDQLTPDQLAQLSALTKVHRLLQQNALVLTIDRNGDNELVRAELIIELIDKNHPRGKIETNLETNLMRDLSERLKPFLGEPDNRWSLESWKSFLSSRLSAIVGPPMCPDVCHAHGNRMPVSRVL